VYTGGGLFLGPFDALPTTRGVFLSEIPRKQIRYFVSAAACDSDEPLSTQNLPHGKSPRRRKRLEALRVRRQSDVRKSKPGPWQRGASQTGGTCRRPEAGLSRVSMDRSCSSWGVARLVNISLPAGALEGARTAAGEVARRHVSPGRVRPVMRPDAADSRSCFVRLGGCAPGQTNRSMN